MYLNLSLDDAFSGGKLKHIPSLDRLSPSLDDVHFNLIIDFGDFIKGNEGPLTITNSKLADTLQTDKLRLR